MTDVHMRLLAWLADHEGASLTSAADALGLELAEVERLVMDSCEGAHNTAPY